MKCQVVLGWDFITPVGAPLEAVVDSAKQLRKEDPPEDGAMHHSNKMYTGNVSM